ncbi:uncharacterized protein M6G45_003623 [Spheniscus humboldti]
MERRLSPPQNEPLPHSPPCHGVDPRGVESPSGCFGGARLSRRKVAQPLAAGGCWANCSLSAKSGSSSFEILHANLLMRHGRRSSAEEDYLPLHCPLVCGAGLRFWAALCLPPTEELPRDPAFWQGPLCKGLQDCLLESAPGTKGTYIKACQIRHYLLFEGCSCSASFSSSSPFYRELMSKCIRGWSFLLCLIWDFFGIIMSQQFYRESHNVGSFVFQFQF